MIIKSRKAKRDERKIDNAERNRAFWDPYHEDAKKRMGSK